MTANTMMQKFAVGDTYGPNEDGIWRAGISAPRWGNRVEVYGENQADAESLRDEILAAWQAAQSVPVVGEPVAWIRKDQLQHVNTFGPALCHVYATEQPGTVALHEKPTTSITAQELDALRKDAERPDCGTCANRGRVDGLSQETFCDHCSWSEKWRKNHYKPIAMQESKS